MSFRRWLVGAGVVGAALLIPASVAWACLGIAGLTVNPATAQPGDTVAVTLTEFGSTPAQIHMDSVSGPVLATIAHPGKGMSGLTTANITIPADTSVGPHVLIATEPGNGMLAGIPARAVIQVGNASLTPTGAARPVALTAASSGISATTIALIALAVAGAGLFLAGMVSLVLSHRRPEAEAVKVS